MKDKNQKKQNELFLYNVALPIRAKTLFTYGSEKEIEKGGIVEVNFRNKSLIGIVISSDIKYSNIGKLKNIIKHIDTFNINKVFIKFIAKFAKYNFCSVNAVLYQFLSCLQKIYKSCARPEHFTNNYYTNPKYTPTVLNIEQNDALIQILNHIKKDQTMVLYGNTGSGKTEVYIKASESILKSNKNAQILILVPEICLAEQTINMVKKRTNTEVLEWHSSVSSKEKNSTLCKILSGNKSIIVGTRSSLIIPYQNLKLIIVDEEHDDGYKQEDKFCYNARDMAVTLGKELCIPVILSSATPSIETMNNTMIEKYAMVCLMNKFHINAKTTITTLQKNKEIISDELIKIIDNDIKKQKQVLIFLNRKGEFRMTVCQNCMQIINCNKCDAPLFLSNEKYKCSYCEKVYRYMEKCKYCDSISSFIFLIGGIETLEKKIQSQLPKAKILTMTKETNNTIDKIKKNISAIEKNEVDIIVGTSIISKGHNFKNINSLIIIDADMGLTSFDIKSNEKVFQILHQVAGRVGRYESGHIYMQTNFANKKNLVIDAIKNMNKEQFYQAEIKYRKDSNLPPFVKMCIITIRNRIRETAKKDAQLIKSSLEISKAKLNAESIVISDFSPCQIHKINNFYRYQILITATKNFAIQKILNSFNAPKLNSSTYVKYDIDPINIR